MFVSVVYRSFFLCRISPFFFYIFVNEFCTVICTCLSTVFLRVCSYFGGELSLFVARVFLIIFSVVYRACFCAVLHVFFFIFVCVFGIEIWACLFTVLGVFVRIKGAEYCFVLAVFFVMIFLLFIGCGFVPISHLFFLYFCF